MASVTSSQAGEASKKRQREEESNTPVGDVDSSLISDASIRPIYQRRFTSTSSRFNDPVTADVILTLHFESSVDDDDDDDVKLYLHSDVLIGKSRYFSASLSDRWQRKEEEEEEEEHTDLKAATFNVPASMGSVDDTMTIFELFYFTDDDDDDDDDDDFSEAINTVSSALSIINSALQLMFEDCVRACLRFLEAVPWSDEEEKRVLSLIPLLKTEESQDLLARIFPVTTTTTTTTTTTDDDSSAELLYGLILEAVNHDNPNFESSKALLSKLLRDFSSRDSARCALSQAFEANLNVLKESLTYLSCPYFWTERGNVQRAMNHERHVTWLIEKMIELRIGETAVEEWHKQCFSDDVMEFFHEYERSDSDIGPLGFVAHMIRCTSKLAHDVVTGSIIADREVRMNLVKDWLPVLIVSKKKNLPIFDKDESTFHDLEKAFLGIISTLPTTDSLELLKQCINLKKSPELLSAFITWFRRAGQPSA